MAIREMAMKDVIAVGEIYTQAFNHQPESIKFYKLEPYVQFCMDEGYAFIAEDDGKTEGFIIGYEKPSMFNGKIAYIELLAVRPEAQHRGNAKRLIDRFIESAQAKGNERPRSKLRGISPRLASLVISLLRSRAAGN